jgi:hypothetical protein
LTHIKTMIVDDAVAVSFSALRLGSPLCGIGSLPLVDVQVRGLLRCVAACSDTHDPSQFFFGQLG